MEEVNVLGIKDGALTIALSGDILIWETRKRSIGKS